MKPDKSSVETSAAKPRGNGRLRVLTTTELGTRLTPMTFGHPSYFVNANFELEWWNEAAERDLLAHAAELPGEISGRNILSCLLARNEVIEAQGYCDLLRFHLSIAKIRLTKATLLTANAKLDATTHHMLGLIYDEAEPIPAQGPVSTDVNLAVAGDEERWYILYAAFFREGVLFSYAPSQPTAAAVATLLSQRDIVIRDILKNRRPYLTKMTVLVADLESSVKICAELPPEEYFELINDIWKAMGSVLRKFYATHGKHVGDGLVYYFLPQPDSNYVFNSIRCAQEMRQRMVEIDRAWKVRKNWLNDLRLNIGLDEGEEWFGTYHTPSHLEFTALGDTINRTARLSDFASGGTIWVTKTMLSKLSAVERQAIPFGIRRTLNGEEIVVRESYARMSNLIVIKDSGNGKLGDIAGLTVAEIFDAPVSLGTAFPGR